jgi:hypothetical protein
MEPCVARFERRLHCRHDVRLGGGMVRASALSLGASIECNDLAEQVSRFALGRSAERINLLS